MKPVSFLNYFKNNKKRVGVLLVSIALVVMMNIIINAFADNMDKSMNISNLHLKYGSEVYFNESKDNPKLNSDTYQSIYNKIKAMKDVDRIIVFLQQHSNMRSMIGPTIAVPVYYLVQDDFDYLIRKFGIEKSLVKTGNQKNDGSMIFLNERFLRAKNLKIGDRIGNEIQKDEWLYGAYSIVGSYTGNVTLGMIPDNQILQKISSGGAVPAYFVIPKLGKLDAVNNFLAQLDRSIVNINSYEKTQIKRKEGMESFDAVFNIFIIVTIIVLSICLGGSSYVHYFNRRREFGLLKAVGYSNSRIVSLMLKETGITVFIGFFSGILMSLLTLTLMNQTIIYQRGLVEMAISWGVFSKLVSIPLFVGMAAILPVLAMLKNIDPITIIERKR